MLKPIQSVLMTLVVFCALSTSALAGSSLDLNITVKYQFQDGIFSQTSDVHLGNFQVYDKDSNGVYHEYHTNFSGIDATQQKFKDVFNVQSPSFSDPNTTFKYNGVVYADRYNYQPDGSGSVGSFDVAQGYRLFGIGFGIIDMATGKAITDSISLSGSSAGFQANKQNMYEFLAASVGIPNALHGQLAFGQLDLNPNNPNNQVWNWPLQYKLSATLNSVTLTNPLTSTGSGASDDPYMPTFETISNSGSVDARSFIFDKLTAEAGQICYIDPIVAVGYEYKVAGDGLVDKLVLPSISGALYQILDASNNPIAGAWNGNTFDFTTNINYFKVMGIPVGAGLDPSDSTAFNSGLVFTQNGNYSVKMTAITLDTDAPTPTPEPASMILMGLGAAGMAFLRRRKASIQA